MTVKQHLTRRKILISFLTLLASVVLIAFALAPNTIHSREVAAAYSKYTNAPSEETKRAYQETADKVNRPFFILQYVSGASGLVLLLVLVRAWRRRPESV